MNSHNDKTQMKYLMNCLLIFQQSLTNMPPAYMARLVFDPRHRCLALVKSKRKLSTLLRNR